MQQLLLDYYLWLKAAHVIAVISWMVGMLYLPRLYVYHVEIGQQSKIAETFKIMEARLLRLIMNPAMIATFIFGILMIMANPDLMKEPWMHGKLTLVVLMAATHGMLAKYRRQLAQGNCQKSATFFRILNEIPTILLIGIVILVIVKPF
jgi:protoporphyrinogen IX oxidase